MSNAYYYAVDIIDTAAHLASDNTIWPKGYVIEESDTGLKKYADGVTAYASLAYSGARLRAVVATAVTNVTNTVAPLTDLTLTLEAGAKYIGEMVVKCANSTAAEGIKFTFDGGSATATAFAAASGKLTGGTSVASVEVSAALATALIYTTITNETWIRIPISMTVNAAGTFIPQFAEGVSHSAGTATVSAGTFLRLEKV